MKNLIRKILEESAKEKFINTVVSRIKPPYFKNLKKLAADNKEIEIISKMLFGEDITINLYSGDYKIINDEGNELYFENSNGYWEKSERDDRGNTIYFEDSDGYWTKQEWDDQGNLTYWESSDGRWEKSEYDERGNLIYYENSVGYSEKWEYDEMGNVIYKETSSKGVIVNKR